MYFKVPEESVHAQRSTGLRAFKVISALLGGSCLIFASCTAISTWSPMLRNPSVPKSTQATSLFGLSTSSSSRSALRQKPGNLLPGPSPWKELALAGIETSNRCGRDMSMKANPVRSVVANMDSASRTVLARAEQTVVKRMQDLKAGQTAPMGFFDPFGLSTNLEGNTGKILFFREAELKHGRVCMLAALGFLVAEKFHPLFGGNIDVPSYVAFQATPLQTFWQLVAIAVAIPEIVFSIPTFRGPMASGVNGTEADAWAMSVLDSTGRVRVPGDLGFDPLGMKPKDPKELLEMQNKELNNGRLAMIAMAGMVAQELVDGQKIQIR